MRLLALETSEYVSSLALLHDGQIVGEQSFASRMNLCETLTARIRELLGDEPLGAGLDALAISQGPGSFTGLRVGMATAKALAHACGLPLVGVPTQQALAAAAPAVAGEEVCVVQKARQGHVYAGLWRKTAAGADEVVSPAVIAIADLPGWLPASARLVAGPATEEVTNCLSLLSTSLRLQSTMPQAAAVARLAQELLPLADPHAAFNLQPLYLLPSQAERQKGLDLSAPAQPWSGLPVPTTHEKCKPTVHLRRATVADLAAIMRIERASFSSPWSELSIREELTGRPGSLFLALELCGEVIGYAGAWLFAGEVHICTIAVAPEQRRRGFAELLMVCVLRYAIGLETNYALLEYRVSNHPAAGLYAKLGFEFIHIRKRYYQDNNEDAVVVAIADLCGSVSRRRLHELYETWLQRYPYEVQLDL